MSSAGAAGARGPNNEDTMNMRLNVVNEIIATERDFVRDLHTIMENIMKPLEDKSGPYAKLFSAADISTLFCNIAMIEVMCSDLLKLFEQVASEAPRPADAAVGKAFIAKKIALTASFSAYCANQSKMLALYDQMKKKAAFNNYVNSLRENQALRGLGLLDWLIKPVQRVTKYPLLLRELERYTPPNHSDRENTVLAARAVQELVDQVNISTKTNESTAHVLRIADEVSDIPSSLQLKSTPGRYYITEGKFIKVSHGKHQDRYFWLFSDLVMYGRPNVASLKKYTYKGTIILTKSNYEDLPDGNEFGANAIRITRMDSKKIYVIYCKEAKQKTFWLTNINELKDLSSKGSLAPSMPTIGVAKISDSTTNVRSSVEFAKQASQGNEQSNNSLLMWSVAVRISGWTNNDAARTFVHEAPVKCRALGRDIDYCFIFSDGWMGTKIKLFKTAQSSKNAFDFKIFVPFELMLYFTAKGPTQVEVGYRDENNGGRPDSYVIEYETELFKDEAVRLFPYDQIGKVRDSDYTKRISRHEEPDSPPGTPTDKRLSRSASTLNASSGPMPIARTMPPSATSGDNFGSVTFGSASYGSTPGLSTSAPHNPPQRMQSPPNGAHQPTKTISQPLNRSGPIQRPPPPASSPSSVPNGYGTMRKLPPPTPKVTTQPPSNGSTPAGPSNGYASAPGPSSGPSSGPPPTSVVGTPPKAGPPMPKSPADGPRPMSPPPGSGTGSQPGSLKMAPKTLVSAPVGSPPPQSSSNGHLSGPPPATPKSNFSTALAGSPKTNSAPIASPGPKTPGPAPGTPSPLVSSTPNNPTSPAPKKTAPPGPQKAPMSSPLPKTAPLTSPSSSGGGVKGPPPMPTVPKYAAPPPAAAPKKWGK